MTTTEKRCDTPVPAHPARLVESPMQCAFKAETESKSLLDLGREFARLDHLMDVIDSDRVDCAIRAERAVPRPKSLTLCNADRALFELHALVFRQRTDAADLIHCIHMLNDEGDAPGTTDAMRYRKAELTAAAKVYSDELSRVSRAASSKLDAEYQEKFSQLKAIGRKILSLPARTPDELAVKAAVVKWCAGGEWEVNWKTDPTDLEFDVAVYSFMRDYFAINDLPGAPGEAIDGLPAIAAEALIAA